MDRKNSIKISYLSVVNLNSKISILKISKQMKSLASRKLRFHKNIAFVGKQPKNKTEATIRNLYLKKNRKILHRQKVAAESISRG